MTTTISGVYRRTFSTVHLLCKHCESRNVRHGNTNGLTKGISSFFSKISLCNPFEQPPTNTARSCGSLVTTKSCSTPCLDTHQSMHKVLYLHRGLINSSYHAYHHALCILLKTNMDNSRHHSCLPAGRFMLSKVPTNSTRTCVLKAAICPQAV